MRGSDWLRTSVGRWTVPVFVLVLGIHIATRGGGWQFEWLRGVLLLTFSCVFLGPLAAGFATWEGSRWSRSQLPRSTGRGAGAAALRAWAALNVWFLATLAGAACVLVVAMKVLGMPALPSTSDLLPVLAAGAMLVGWSTVGFAVGYRSGSTVLAAPLLAGAAFALTIALWGGPGRFMQVGGTFSSIVGMRVKPTITTGQVLFWLGVIVVGATVITLSRKTPARSMLGLAAGLCIAFVGFHLTDQGDGLLFTATPVTLRCTPLESGTDLCLAPGYERRRSTAAAAVDRALEQWVAAGLSPPERITQVYRGRRADSTWIDARDLVDGNVNGIEWGLVNTPVAPSCDLYADPDAMHAFDTLQAAVVRDPEGSGTIADPAPPPNAPPPRQGADVRAAYATLQKCGAHATAAPHP